jgi:hypothetical protein
MIMRVVPASLLCLAVTLASCAQDVGEIDRTQPNLLPKAMFRDHAWFVRQTVTDVPPTSEFSFVGETGTMEIINWEIQQQYLVGYRAYERVPGSDSDADHGQNSGGGAQAVAPGYGSGRDPSLFKGNPIVAYPILDQVDVIRDYNPRTGEQTNVIREDTVDRPWHERAYIRVDWSRNLVANFEFISTARSIEPTNSGYVEENEGGPDAFLKHTDEQGDVDYFDFTERLFVEPTDNGCLLSWNYRLGDCTGDEVKVRTSFLRVDEEREADYVPMAYDDQRQGEFGYFRIERPTYDRRRGVTWSGAQQLVTRFDLWRNSRDQAGNPLSYAQRGLRPVVYSLNAQFPDELKPVARRLAGEWDAALKETAAAARGQTPAQFEEDLVAESGDTCMFCLDENADGHARIGDLRYNFIYWVDHPQPAGPLGYGPSSPNPETGRIVAGMAYVYGAGVDTQSQDAQDIVDLLNGEYTPEDFLEADFVREQVLARRPALANDAARALDQIPISADPTALLSPNQRARLTALKQSGLPPAKPGYDAARLAQIRGTAFERMLINDEVVVGRGQGAYQPGDPLSDEAVAQLSPASWATVEARRKAGERREKASRHCVWLKEFSDPGVVGLAKATQAAGLKGDALWQTLREDIFESTMLHEIGHTLGLRHNFSGSADALNYLPEYWPLREQTILANPRTTGSASVGDLLSMSCERETAANSDACAAQREGRMAEFQYSTVMDYGAKFNSDIHGIGHYDRAAIAAAYGDLVEVFEPEVTDALNVDDRDLLEAMGDVRMPLQGSLTVHYTQLPDMFGDSAALERRSLLPRSHYLAARARGDAPLRVPYIACYEEYVDATPYCHRWDAGADPYEITMHYVNTYREYYPLVNFQRDRVAFSPAAVGDRMTDRFFLPVANMYQQWLLNSFGGGSDNGLLESYSILGVLRGFSMLWGVMSTPRYGSYELLEGPDGPFYRWRSYNRLSGALYVPPGEGRRQFSRYDVSAGFNFYQRVLESGYFYEQIGALLALTASDASVLGIGADIDADSLAYSIPYYIMFQEQIDGLFSGIISEDFQGYAPYVVDDQIVGKDLWLEDFVTPPADAPRLEVTVPWSTQLYTMLYGMSLLSSNFDTSFLHKAQVAVAGEGEPVTPADGFETLSGSDPFSGRTYLAYRDPNGAKESFIGAKLVERLTADAAAFAAAPEGSTDQVSARNAVQNDVQLLEILRSLYGQFESVLQVSFSDGSGD